VAVQAVQVVAQVQETPMQAEQHLHQVRVQQVVDQMLAAMSVVAVVVQVLSEQLQQVLLQRPGAMD
jgi:hypothetical protein